MQKDGAPDALPRTTWQDAIDAVASAHLHLRPVYFGDGLIKCAVGYYRMACDTKGRVALLFGFSPEHLQGKKYSFIDDKVFVAHNHPLYVVDVRQEDPPKNPFNSAARPRPWVEPMITEHQEALRSLFLNYATLYETESGKTWQNSSVAYRLFPDGDTPADAEGKTLFKLRFYSAADISENGFVAVDETEDDRKFSATMHAYAVDKGSFTAEEARRFVFRDFFERIQRTRLGLKALSKEEIRENPLRYFISRQAQKLYSYHKKTPPLAKVRDIGKIILLPLSVIIDPKAILEKIAEKIGSLVEKKILAKRLRKKTPIDEFRDPPPEGTKLRDPSYARAKTDSLSAFMYMSAEEAHAAPDNAHVFKDLHDDWAKEWLLSALQGRSAMLAWPRSDNVVSLQQPNGLLIYYHHANKGRSRKAFAQLRPNWRQPEAPPIPESVEKLFAGNNRDIVVEIDMDYGHIKTRQLTYQQFRETLAQITGNESWKQSTNPRTQPPRSVTRNPG